MLSGEVWQRIISPEVNEECKVLRAEGDEGLERRHRNQEGDRRQSDGCLSHHPGCS